MCDGRAKGRNQKTHTTPIFIFFYFPSQFRCLFHSNEIFFKEEKSGCVWIPFHVSCCLFLLSLLCYWTSVPNTEDVVARHTKHRRIEQNIERKKKKKRKAQTTSSENAKINIRSRDKANNSAAAVGQIRFQQLRDKILTNRYVCVFVLAPL